MRWYHQLPIVMGVFVALAAAAGPSFGASGSIKATVENGTLTVTGTNGDDTLTLVLRDAATVAVDSGSSELFAFDRSTFDHIVVNAGGGDDLVTVSDAGGIFTDTEITTLNGQGGDDTLRGGAGNETLDGGPGDDFVDGNRGTDLALLGSGNDTFQWDPGDASDVIEGQTGKDTLLFNGSNAGEHIDLSANGNRLLLFRDVANVTQDADGIENVDINALGGPDTITVNDLTGTDVHDVITNLQSISGTGDEQPDQIVVNGTAAADAVQVGDGKITGLGPTVEAGSAGIEPADAIVVNGLGGDDQFTADPTEPITVKFDGGEGTDTTLGQGTSGDDTIGIAPVAPAVALFGAGPGTVQSIAENLVVRGFGGDDTIAATNGIAGLTALTIEGDSGNDTLRGGDGDDTLIGGPGDDFVDGNRGTDLALLGSGNDTFQWDPGDGSDTVEGQAGKDTMVFNGSNAGEQIDLSANGNRLRLFRNVANVTMDTDGVETVEVNALGGADAITVNDLSGTDVRDVGTNLESSLGGGDTAADGVVVNGTQRRDVIEASGAAGTTTVTGLAATVMITGAEVPGDRLAINALGGDDTVDASGLAADAISLQIDGGEGDDRLTGGAGDDILIGGPGDDVLDGGPGNNTLIP